MAIHEIPYVVNKSGVFKYNTKTDSFSLDITQMNLVEGRGAVKRIIEREGHLWYITSDQTLHVEPKFDGIKATLDVNKYSVPPNVYVGGFENMHPANENNHLICTNRGVLYHSFGYKNQLNARLKAIVEHVLLIKQDSMISVDGQLAEHILKYEENDLLFSFRTNGRSKDELKGYQYILEGFDTKWSALTSTPFKEYSNLNPGSYIFKVRAFDKYGNISDILGVAFKIDQPYYMSFWAWTLYSFCFLIFILALVLIPQNAYRKSKEQLVEKQKQTEKEVEEVKQAKLESEIQFKNKELASTTLHLLQKKQTLSSVMAKINEFKKNN